MRKAEEFERTKNAYLVKQKIAERTGTEPAISGRNGANGKSRNQPVRPKHKVSAVPKTMKSVRKITVVTAIHISSFPVEILLKIFSFLTPKSLLSCASTCKQWTEIASSESLWKPLYARYVHFGPQPPSTIRTMDWKRKFFTDAKKARNNRLRKSLKRNQYTGIVNDMQGHLRKSGIKFELMVRLKDGSTQIMIEQSRHYFSVSTLLQWHSLENVPKLRDVKSMEIRSLTPILFGKDGQFLKNSPRQKCLVFVENLKCEEIYKNRISSCDKTDAFVSKLGILFAIWKRTDELAFVCATLHNHQLLNKCLLSTYGAIYNPIHTVKPDDVSCSYGLQGYKFHILIATGDSGAWEKVLHSDAMTESLHSHTAAFSYTETVGSFPELAFFRALFQWTTEVFQGTLENVAFLTITARDSNSDIVWCMSRPVKCQIIQSEVLNMGSDTNTSLELSCGDEVGKVELHFDAMRDCDSRMGEIVPCEFSFKRIIVNLNLKFINEWFGTKY